MSAPCLEVTAPVSGSIEVSSVGVWRIAPAIVFVLPLLDSAID